MKKNTKSQLKTIVSLLLVLIVAFSLAGCSRDNNAVEENGGEEKKDQALVIATYSAGHCFLDPHQTTGYNDYDYMNQVYDTLVVTDFDGSTIKAGLADSWDVSEDGLHYTFHLKNNVKFHSGKSMTSKDVKWTYERWNEEKTASPTRAFVSAIESINTPDDYTVVFNLSQPDNNLLINLTVPVASILNKESVESSVAEGKVYGTEVVDGTGPYKFVEYIENDRVILARNDEYAWGPEIFKNKGPAKLSEVTIRFLPEPGTRLMEFQAGNVDILGNGCLFASELDKLKKLDFVEVLDFSPPYPVFIQFQLDHVTDLIVRQACNMAIDRDEIIHTVMGDTADPLVGALPSHYEWYWKGADNYYPHDLGAANKLLEDNGYILKDDGFRYKDGEKLAIDIMFCSADEDRMTADLFQAQMKKVGIDVSVNTAMVSNFWSHINTNEFDTLIMGLYLNTPEDMLYEYMSSNNIPYPNRQSFKNDEVDELLNMARVTPDKEKRKEAYDRIQEIAMETAMWIPLYNRNGFLVINKRVKDLTPHPTIVEGMPKLLDAHK